jgi:hypothetical protein
MSIKAPPVPLHAPNYTSLSKGTLIHRVHLSTYAGNSFNPCAGGQTRFAPITDASGACIPSLYGGSTLDSAIYETIFHDIPAKAAMKTVRKADVTQRSHTGLTLTRTMTLVSLRSPDLLNWAITRNSLIASSPKLYSQTAAWAKAIHDAFANADGLVWTSNKCDPDSAYLFFGGRVSAGDFTITTTRHGATDPTFLSDVRNAGSRGGITITI